MIEFYVFGSLTTGEVDPGSDVDVLVIVDDAASGLSFPNTWSVYSRKRIEDLYSRGTLFAWHLHHHAVPVCPRESGLVRSLGEPAPYSHAKEEIAALSAIGRSAVFECRAHTPSLVYELGILYLVSRDIAMAAAPDVLGHFTFSRYAPYEYPNTPFPLEQAEYQYAMDCRRAASRGHDTKRNEATEKTIVAKAESLLAWNTSMIEEVQCSPL